MILDRIRLIGLNPIDFPLIYVLPSDPYILKAVDGLGPPEISVIIANTLQQGGYYQGRRPNSRQIVMRVGLNPDYSSGQTASDLRTELYGLLAPSVFESIEVQLMSNAATVDMITTGYVSKIEIVPFSKDPEIQITVDCTQPYFWAPEMVTVIPGTKNNFTLTNPGTAPTGLRFEIEHTTAKASGWTLYQSHSTAQSGAPNLTTTYHNAIGDELRFWTEPGERKTEIVRGSDGTVVNIIHTITNNSDWLFLPGGDSIFSVSGTGFEWIGITLQPRFWGI